MYTRGRQKLEAIMQLVDRVSGAVGMKLGLRKCAVVHMVGGRLIHSEDFLLDKDRVVSAVTGGNTYQYLPQTYQR